MFETVLRQQYGLHLVQAEKARTRAGSDTWFLHCTEGAYVLKFPAGSAINHPEAEPALCAFLRSHGIPACDFVKSRTGKCIARDSSGRFFTVQRRFPGTTPEWNSAQETLLLETAELLGKIHHVLQKYPELPEGIGAGFFAHMTPQHAVASYRRSLETAIRLGDAAVAADLEWRIDFVAQFPVWPFDLGKLTLCNTHGDYFISQFLCENGHLTAVIDWTSACVHPVIWEIRQSNRGRTVFSAKQRPYRLCCPPLRIRQYSSVGTPRR